MRVKKYRFYYIANYLGTEESLRYSYEIYLNKVHALSILDGMHVQLLIVCCFSVFL